MLWCTRVQAVCWSIWKTLNDGSWSWWIHGDVDYSTGGWKVGRNEWRGGIKWECCVSHWCRGANRWTDWVVWQQMNWWIANCSFARQVDPFVSPFSIVPIWGWAFTWCSWSLQYSVKLREIVSGVVVNLCYFSVLNSNSSVLLQVPCKTIYRHLEDLLVTDDISDGRGMSKTLTHYLRKLWASTFCRYGSTGSRMGSGARLQRVRWANHQCCLYMCILWTVYVRMY